MGVLDRAVGLKNWVQGMGKSGAGVRGGEASSDPAGYSRTSDDFQARSSWSDLCCRVIYLMAGLGQAEREP